MRIPIGKLITPIQDIKVFPSTPLSEVLIKMSINRLTALPVVNDVGTLQGVITVFAIIQVWKNPRATPNNLIVSSTAFELLDRMRPAPVAADKDLYDHIEQLMSSTHDHLHIIDNDSDKKALGIISKAKLIEVLFKISQPYILTKEIEGTLRRYIRYAYKDEANLSLAIANLKGSSRDNNNKALALVTKLRAEMKFAASDEELQGRVNKSFPIKVKVRLLEDLTFSELMQLLQDKSAWAEVEPAFHPFDSDGWTQRILPALDARNDVFHFRKEIDLQITDELSGCANWLNTCSFPERVEPIIQPNNEPVPLDTATHSEAEVIDSFKNFIQRLETEKAANAVQIHFISSIQSIIDILPPEASTNADWWQTDSIYIRQWTDKKWRVKNVDIEEGYVTFSAIQKR